MRVRLLGALAGAAGTRIDGGFCGRSSNSDWG